MSWVFGCCCSIVQSCPTLCNPTDCSMPGFCLSQSPKILLNSCPLIRWCHPTISSSVIPFSSCLQSFQHQNLFQWVSSLHQVTKVWSINIRPSSEYSWFISFRIDWFDLLAVQGTLKSLLQHHSSKASILWHSAFFIVHLSHLYMTTGKTTALTRWTFVGKVISLLFNMLDLSKLSSQGASVF